MKINQQYITTGDLLQHNIFPHIVITPRGRVPAPSSEVGNFSGAVMWALSTTDLLEAFCGSLRLPKQCIIARVLGESLPEQIQALGRSLFGGHTEGLKA